MINISLVTDLFDTTNIRIQVIILELKNILGRYFIIYLHLVHCTSINLQSISQEIFSKICKNEVNIKRFAKNVRS